MLKCKVCQKHCTSLEGHVQHHALTHATHVARLSPFTCGYEMCTAKFARLDSYHKHFMEFHQSSISNSSTSTQNDSTIGPSVQNFSDSDLRYKCAQPGCNYSGKSKSTLRTHRFWYHRSQEPSLTAVSGTSASEAVSRNMQSISSASHSLSDELVSDEQVNNIDANADIVPLASGAENSFNGQSTDMLLTKLVHMSLRLTTKHHIPDSTLAFVLDSYDKLLKVNAYITADLLKKELQACGLDADAIESVVKKVVYDMPLLKLHGVESPMRSFYMRQQQYQKLFPYVKPTQHCLQEDDTNTICKYHSVAIDDSLKALFEDDSVNQQYIDSQKRSVLLTDDLTDIQSGLVFKNHPLFSTDPSALQLILYQDDVEMGIALGPAAGTCKILHMAYTLGNLYPWNRSKVDPLQLVMLCKDKDVAYFGLPRVLEPVIEKLKALEERGVEIRGKTVKAGVLVLLGDNLGTHTIGGFTEGFSKSKYFCRYCEESREEWKKRWYGVKGKLIEDADDSSSSSSESEDESSEEELELEENEEDKRVDDDSSDDDVPLADFIPLADLNRQMHKIKAPLRTKESYGKCVEQLRENPDGVKGVVADSELNKLKNFHVVQGTPPCLPHDIFLGIIPYDLLLCIKKLKKTYKFSFDFLNRKIKSFRFQGTDKLDKPPPKFHSRRKKIKGNAVQNHNLLRFLPLLIGDKVTNKKEPFWLMILTLIEIVEILTSPVISKTIINHLEKLIHKYLHYRVTLFPNVPLRCKHHYLEHYPWLILLFGPLMRVATLRFESKHVFYRSEFRGKKNMKNVTKMLARAHQQMQSSLKVDNIFEIAPVVEEPTLFEGLQVEDSVMKCLLLSFGKGYACKLLYSNKITFHNVMYESGKIIVTSTSEHPQIECCKINLLLSDGKTAFVIGSKCFATLIEDMQIYELKETAVMTVINLNSLKDYVPYPIYYYKLQSIIVLKHLYLQK